MTKDFLALTTSGLTGNAQRQSGRRICMRDPPLSLAAAISDPPCASATLRAMASPRPVPPVSRLRVGDVDDWTPADRCIRWRDEVIADGHTVRLKVYPNALHGFDSPNMPHIFAGHYTGRDPRAAEDALLQTQDFLAAHLQRER